MAPRTGPRGVTNEDVANRAGVTYVYAPETPAQQNQVNQQALLSYVLGGQAPGYGKKYGGFPTAGYGQAAIEGQAFGIADLARQAAQQAAVREAELYSSADRQLRTAESQAASEMRRAQRQAESTFGGLSESEDPMARYIGQKITGSRFQDLSGEREAELRRREAPIEAQLRSGVASQVTPYQQISETLNYSPSQLAQQIAVSRYGYDPMLAAGLFGGETDIKYSTQAQAMEDARLRAMGYDTTLSTDELIARSGLSPEEFQAYQQQKALNALGNVMEPDYSQQDVELFDVYGTTPSNESERAIMLDPDFLTLVENSKQAMLQADKAINPNAVVATIARNYLANGGEPAYALMLEDILSRFSFLVQPIGTNIDVPGV